MFHLHSENSIWLKFQQADDRLVKVYVVVKEWDAKYHFGFSNIFPINRQE